MTLNENGEVTKLAVGDFDTSLRVSASVAHLVDRDQVQHGAPFSIPPSPSSRNTANLFANVKASSGPDPTASEKRTAFASNRPRSTVGTAGFMAPEVMRARNSTPYGFKVDVYSFGMVLYELITLKLPFEQLDTCDIITAVLEGEVVPSMEVDPTLRAKYWSLVELHRRCTLREPNERPSWREILSILQAIRTQGAARPQLLLSQKSQLSLRDQLTLYSNPGAVKVSLTNSPSFVHRRPVADLPESISMEFDTITTPSQEPATLPLIDETSLTEEEPVKNAALRFRGASTRAEEDDSEASESEVSTSEGSRGRRSMVRKVIVEIRDQSGNVIREEIREELMDSSPRPTLQSRGSVPNLSALAIGRTPIRKRSRKGT